MFTGETLTDLIMKKTLSVILILAFCIVTGIFVTGCTQTSTAPPTTATTPQGVLIPQNAQNNTQTLANPASVNCVNIGGTLEIKNGVNGQYGMCNFPNGTSCEEWALFRGEGCKMVNVSV